MRQILRAIHYNEVDCNLLNKPLLTWRNASNIKKMQCTQTGTLLFSNKTERNVTHIHNLLIIFAVKFNIFLKLFQHFHFKYLNTLVINPQYIVFDI